MEKEILAKNAMCAFFAANNIKSQKEMTYFSSHRLKHKNGNILTILNQYKPFLFDSAGKMWMTIGISNLSTKNHFVESFIEVEGTNERFIFNPQKKDFNQIHKINLSNKEQQILILASQGYTSKEIAATQEVSLNTIKFHKQNILFKLNAQNISEAILYAYSHNLF